jgi:protein-S-isoprenylcysteine O-methyltransferase Ste14
MSLLLVAIQFALILLLLLPLPAALLSSYAAMAMLTAGVVLGVWTLYFNRIGNFNIRPEPKTGARLVTDGPYRFIRHPMYTAVLLMMAPFAFASDDAIRIFYWVLLLAVLQVKSSIEEKMLKRQFPEYVGYQRKTGRFLPRLFRSGDKK